MSVYDKTHYNIVISLQLIKINEKKRKQINVCWNNYEDNEGRRKYVLQSPSPCLFTTILIHRDDDISVPKSISLQLLISFFPINGSLSGMFSSVQFSHSVMSNSLQLHGLQHARPPCPSRIPGVHSNSCPLSRWCHSTVSFSVIPFSSCLQSFPTSGSFQMSQFFLSGSQSIGVSASTSVLPMNIQDWSPLGWTGWISLQSKGLSRVFSNTTVQKHQFFSAQLSLQSNSHIHTWLLEKP